MLEVPDDLLVGRGVPLGDVVDVEEDPARATYVGELVDVTALGEVPAEFVRRGYRHAVRDQIDGARLGGDDRRSKRLQVLRAKVDRTVDGHRGCTCDHA